MACNCGSEDSEHGTVEVECIDPDGCEFKPWGYRTFGGVYELPCKAAYEFIATWPQRLKLHESESE